LKGAIRAQGWGGGGSKTRASLTTAQSLPAGATACTAYNYCSPGAVQAACDSVLVVHADYASFALDVQATLRGTGAFSAVDLFDASAGTPTAAQLAAYHAVLTYSNNPFNNSVLLGDRLAEYHDRGGGVVVAMFGNQGSDATRLKGAFGDAANGYALLDYALGGHTFPLDSLGNVLEPDSPLMSGVATFAASWGYRSTAPVVSGRGVVVARWRGGGKEPLVLRGARGSRTLVELNCVPASNSSYFRLWTGDGAALLRNAVKYSRCLLHAPGSSPSAGEAQAAGVVRGEGLGRRQANKARHSSGVARAVYLAVPHPCPYVYISYLVYISPVQGPPSLTLSGITRHVAQLARLDSCYSSSYEWGGVGSIPPLKLSKKFW
jgi:hypothetical protein